MLSNAIIKELDTFIEKTPRADIVRMSLDNYGGVITVDTLEEGITVIDAIAPEHLGIMTEYPENAARKVRNAGAMFPGSYTPGAAGDYRAGPNHMLPTSGAARFASPLNVLDYMKFTSITGYTQTILHKHAEAIAVFAKAEKLFAHAKSVEVRDEQCD